MPRIAYLMTISSYKHWVSLRFVKTFAQQKYQRTSVSENTTFQIRVVVLNKPLLSLLKKNCCGPRTWISEME